MEKISFKDVDMKRDAYILKLYPSSFFSLTPAAKTQEAIELAQAFPQVQDQVLAVLDFPDLSTMTSLVNAPLEIVDAMADKILEDDEPMTPEPSMDLALTIKRMNMHLLRAKLRGVEDEPGGPLDKMRAFIAQAEKLQQKAMQPPPGPMPGAEQGMPPEGAPPVDPMAAMPVQ